MPFIEGATESIFYHYCPETQINSVEHGGQHAHVGFRTGDNKGFDAFIVEEARKLGFCKRGVGGLIYYRGRRYQAG